MTSKTSFNKHLKENIRHRGWLAAVSWILLFLTGPVYTMLTWESRFSDMNPNSFPGYGQSLLQSFPGVLNGKSALPLAAVIFLLALFCAVTGFSYLDSTEKVDFYHSLPLTRSTWFGISYMSGLLLFLVPYLVTASCTLLLGFAKHLLSITILPDCCLAILGGILGFLVIYHVTILAMMLTGKLITGVLAALTISVYADMVEHLIRQLAASFFDTYSASSFQVLYAISDYLSPFGLFRLLLERSASVSSASGIFPASGWVSTPFASGTFSQSSVSMGGSLLLIFLGALLFLIVLASISLWLYRHRPSEAAENALAYPGTAPFIKILVTIPTALYIGPLMISQYNSDTRWIIPISILSAILLCGIIEFIYYLDLRKLFFGYRSSMLSIFGVMGILCILEFDLFGYDQWLPQTGSVKEMAIFTDNFSEYFSYIPASYLRIHALDTSWNRSTLTKEYAPLYRLAKEGIENAENGITPEQIRKEDVSDNYLVATMQFQTGKHSSAFRTYALEKTHVLEALDELCQDEEYRKSLFPFFQLSSEDILNISLMDIYSDPLTLDLSLEERAALLEAYEKDLLNADLPDMQNTLPVGELVIEIPEYEEGGLPASSHSGYRNSIPGFYLYRDYRNTLSLLEKYGYSLRTKIQTEDVVSMLLTESSAQKADDAIYGDVSYSSVYENSNERLITDPEEITEILTRIQYPSGRLLGRDTNAAYSVEIMLKGNPGSHYYTLSDSIS